jgi:LAO/AO transport system kinase
VWELFKILGTDERQQLFLWKHKEQNQYWMLETINEQLKTISTNIQKFKSWNNKKKRYKMMNFTFAAAQILEKYFKF